jgi:hypothetical protein
MSSWNYRLIQKKDIGVYIGEVFYDDDGVPIGYTDPVAIFEETEDDLRKTLIYINIAQLRPILDVDVCEFSKKFEEEIDKSKLLSFEDLYNMDSYSNWIINLGNPQKKIFFMGEKDKIQDLIVLRYGNNVKIVSIEKTNEEMFELKGEKNE